MELSDLVRLWGQAREINNPDKQTIKLMEEVGELAHEICRGNYDSEELKDAIGDIQVVLIILADMLGFKTEDCLKKAYDEIIGRTGVTKNGCFIKNGE